MRQEAEERIDSKQRSSADQLARKLRFSSKVLGDLENTCFLSSEIGFAPFLPNHVVFSYIPFQCVSCGREMSDETTNGFLVPRL